MTPPSAIKVHRDGFGPITFKIQRAHAQRKRRGMFYTSWDIAMALSHAVVREYADKGAPSEVPTICDPFVGAGVLPAALIEVLADAVDPPAATPLTATPLTATVSNESPGLGNGDRPSRGCLLENCYGIDVDPHAVSVALQTLSGGQAAVRASLAQRLVVADTLTLSLDGMGFLPNSLAALFPEVAAQGGFDLIVANPPWEKVRVNDREFFDDVHPGFARLSRAKRDRLKPQLLVDSGIAVRYQTYRAQIDRLKNEARTNYETAGSGGDLDTYKLAVERCLKLAKPAGLVGLIVPHGLLGDWGARELRSWLLAHHDIREIVRFETGPTLFPEIHANLGVILIVIRRSTRTARAAQRPPIRISPALRQASALARPTFTDVPCSVVQTATPWGMLPLVDRSEDLEFLNFCDRFPLLAHWPKERFQPRREIDMSLDRRWFQSADNGTPLLEGKHLSSFALAAGNHRWAIDPDRLNRVGQRVAWRAVADRAMARRLIGAWVPIDVALGNSLIYTEVSSDDKDGLHELLYLLAWLNSRIADAQLRLWCANNNINIFHIKCCRVPRWCGQSTGHEMLALTASLVSPAQRAQLPKPYRQTQPVTGEERAQVVDQIDECWRQIYGISRTVWEASVLSRTAPISAG